MDINNMWTRTEAIWIIERLEPILAPLGAHCGLTGSVLYRGDSLKDLDIIIYPHHSDENEPWELYEIENALVQFFKADRLSHCEGVSQIRDSKKVAWLLTPKKKRVDFFFLQ